MNHSLEGYLARQSTETLEMLLRQYEEAVSELDAYTSLLIRNILKERKAAGKKERQQ